MVYDLDNRQRGLRDCPRCHFPMESLRRNNAQRRNDGYILDTGIGWDPDDHIVTSFLLGNVRRFLWRHFGEPLVYKFLGRWQQRRYDKIVARFPESLFCPHCGYVLKRA